MNIFQVLLFILLVRGRHRYAPHNANKLLQAKAKNASKLKTLTLRTTSRRRKHTNEAKKKKKWKKRTETTALTDFVQDAYISQ